MFEDETSKPDKKEKITTKIETQNKDDVTLPLGEDNDSLDYDLQKELEAKFDELFGGLNDDD